MDSVNKTLYIPLYGKAYVSSLGIFLHDPKAEEIWKKEGFALKGKAKSKWLAYYMSMRACVFDRWVTEQLRRYPGAVVVHIGCGMDSRVCRVDRGDHLWFDLDFPEVIRERKKYYTQDHGYRMLGYDVTDFRWLDDVPRGHGIIVMEGVSMYLQREMLRQVLERICDHFQQVQLLMDCYSTFAAKASVFKNPVREVGVTQVYGLDDPQELERNGLCFVAEKEMTPEDLIGTLKGGHRTIFRRLYAGSVSKKLYRLYEYEGKTADRG